MSRFATSRARVSIATLAASLVLSVVGAGALVFYPQVASAELSKQTPEFVVGPGDTVAKEFQKVLIGSAEVRPNPDQCRTDSAMGLTCAAHRLKVNRQAGFHLTLVLEWTAAGGAGAFLPDMDLYLFDDATSKFDSAEVGGAGTGMPEQLSLTPAQDEYDIVVQAWGGVVAGYKITAFYSDKPLKESDVSVTPDIVLTPDNAPFRKTYTSPLAVPTTGSPLFYPLVHWLPEDCRSNPAYDGLCDVHRIKVNRNKAKGAVNFVVVELIWDATPLPDLALVAAGLGLGYLPDLDMFVWDTPEHALPREAVGGQGDGYPERLGFVATQDEYDLTIQSGKGVSAGYTLTAFVTDEIFDKPFEVLDPQTGQREEPGGRSGTPPVDGSEAGNPSVPNLGLAPIDVDEQIAGIGLGTTENFDADEALRLGRAALRPTSASTEPPSGVVLVLTMLVLPLAFFFGGIVVLRRRHNELI